VQWDPRYGVGNESIDNQHRNMLAQCNALADCVADTGPEADRQFHEIFNQLMAQAREHFASEETLLARCPDSMREEQKDERDEFEYLAADIITTENFDKLELQRFLALWWVGHIMGSGKRYRACMAGTAAD
jgi:hemerythrin-like metal-binding protein